MLKLFLIAAVTSSLMFACNDQLGTKSNPITEQGDCTLTQGYWKNHASEWPVTSVTLGSVTYTQAQALDIFAQPVAGNGLVSLAHQLIAAKLNVASGASNTVVNEIAQADSAIGALVVPPVGAGYLSTASTAGLAQALDDYNTGKTGPGHCDGVGKPDCACGDGVVHAPEECDDGNTINGDGCSSICRFEPVQ
ncbi:MAG TPA: myxococcus cysteine-rich repeat containing protein [Kofleriaceae bacterium]